MIDKKVYSETYAILLALGEDYINPIPAEVFEFTEQTRDPNCQPQIDENKEFKDQPILKETFAMIAALRLNYWCKSEKEKTEFLEYLGMNNEEFMIPTRELINILKENN